MLCPFREYSNLFGKPGKGVHRFRFADTAIVDYTLTLLAAITTSLLTGIPLVLTTISWLILGIVLHILFGVQTSTLKYLNINC